MEAKKRTGSQVSLFLCLLFFSLGQSFSAPLIKVQVISDNAFIKATQGIATQTLATVPLDTVLDAEVKQGQWYKVYYLTKENVRITGWIHEILVKEVGEKEAQQATLLTAKVKSQADIAAEIELKMDEDRNLIRQEKDLDKALEELDPLIAKSFSIDDRQKQKQIACEIYLLIGSARVKKGDGYGALKEFRKMFDVDNTYAKEITRNFSDPLISGFIEHAEKLSKGLLLDYVLEIATNPKEAVIKIDGKEIGRSPEVYRTVVPKFTLEIEKEGYKPITEVLFLSQASTKKEYALESLGRTLTISSNPKEATVFLDGKNTGKRTDCELSYIPYGGHALKLVRENYADWEETIKVEEGSGPLPVSALLNANQYICLQRLGGPADNFFRFPKGIAFDKEGSFYIVDESYIKAKKFDSEGRFQSSWGEAGKQSKALKAPAGIALDSQGNIYITDAKASCVAKFEKSGKFVKNWGGEGTKPNELSGPSGIAVDNNGDVYVADTRNNRIAKYSSVGVLKITWGKQGTLQGEFVMPSAVTVNQKNEIIVIDRTRIQKFSPEGEFISAWGQAGSGDGEMKGSLGIGADLQNNIYIADTGNNRILKFDPNGKLISQWGTAGITENQMMSPSGVAINDKGIVFVIERDNHRLQEFGVPSK